MPKFTFCGLPEVADNICNVPDGQDSLIRRNPIAWHARQKTFASVADEPKRGC